MENDDEPAQADNCQEQRARHLVRSDLPRQRSVLSPAAGFAWFGCSNGAKPATDSGMIFWNEQCEINPSVIP